ncbi:hypothetical protein Cadr_000014628, partial [Camelus dromedarius]
PPTVFLLSVNSATIITMLVTLYLHMQSDISVNIMDTMCEHFEIQEYNYVEPGRQEDDGDEEGKQVNINLLFSIAKSRESIDTV